ncbi:hypothetical protein AAHE18_04G163800 [Arachis hypogaea]
MSLPFAATFNYQRQATINYFINVYNPTIINLIATTHPDPFIIRRHKIYAFILFALLAFLQIQNTGSTPSPFHDHPVTTQACFLAIFCYFLAFMASLRLPQYSSQLSTAMAAFGSFSSATLVTLLIPESWWNFRYVFYVLVGMVELHPLLTVLYDRYILRSVLRMRRSWQQNSQRQQQLLPLRYMDLMSREHSNNTVYLMEAPLEVAVVERASFI